MFLSVTHIVITPDGKNDYSCDIVRFPDICTSAKQQKPNYHHKYAIINFPAY